MILFGEIAGTGGDLLVLAHCTPVVPDSAGAYFEACFACRSFRFAFGSAFDDTTTLSLLIFPSLKEKRRTQ